MRSSGFFEAIVIGGSSGALDALSIILPALPARFTIPIAIVIHVPPNRPSLLASVLGSRCALRVREVEDKEPVAPATVFVAPPNYHLLLERQRTFALSIDAPIHYSRPAIDALFESAAEAYGEALLAVLLAGANEDGARGAHRVKAMGGTVVVQEPSSTHAPEMPKAAMRAAPVDSVLAPQGIAEFLVEAGRRATPAESRT
ncbi:MAG TPA: chemotaxis protein CheB [Kofleriaceae bacterium]|nr:chemotaxis protein CheB [Kofleriaceae bacterium]